MTASPLDIICLGRTSVDLYGQQLGGRLEDTRTFARYVGGCPANIAIGTARLGLKSALITRVGDEQLGNFVLETLNAEGVDTSHVTRDPDRLTALVILGIRDAARIPHIFYRSDCADMALEAAHIDAEFIAAARSLLVTGTHLSREGVAAASLAAIDYARSAGRKVILDIDYRPVLWGMATNAEGERRFAAGAAITERLQTILPHCDLVVGTEEEVHIAGGFEDTLSALRAIREKTGALIILKQGPAGCMIFEKGIPDQLDASARIGGYPIEVFNTLGAGDGFLSGFLGAWLKGTDAEASARQANACGALVVSRHGCAPAMPDQRELAYFMETARAGYEPRKDRWLARLHRAAAPQIDRPQILALAFDHRSQFEALAERHGKGPEDIRAFKRLVFRAAQRVVGDSREGAFIVDGRYGASVLADLAGSNCWFARPIELPGSRPLAFEGGDDVAGVLADWPAHQIVKCLVTYHPDDPAEIRQAQDQSLKRLYDAILDTGLQLLIEVLPPEDRRDDQDAIVRAIGAIYDNGVYPDWWKLPPSDDPEIWRKIEGVVAERDPCCNGIVILGLNAPDDELRRGFIAGSGIDLCRGFAIGRSIFQSAADAWFAGRIDDGESMRMIVENYTRVIGLWREAHAPTRQSPSRTNLEQPALAPE